MLCHLLILTEAVILTASLTTHSIEPCKGSLLSIGNSQCHACRQGMGVTGGEPLGFDVGAKAAGGTLPGLDLVCGWPQSDVILGTLFFFCLP